MMTQSHSTTTPPPLRLYPWVWLALLLSLAGCQATESVETQDMTEELKQDFATLATGRIFFGHQSVGKNIIAGIEDLQQSIPDNRINIVELGNNLPGSYLVHSRVGENTKPTSKCDDFKRIIDTDLADKIDYALLKFCYIDIREKSDVEAIFAHYRKTLDELKAHHPEITFIHVTAPLRHSPSGVTIWLRELIGQPNRSKLANIKRNEFNALLRSTYASDPILDIAESESTYPDGRRESFSMNGKTYYGMIGAYTHDGGHLNETGRQHVAADLVRGVAAIMRSRNGSDS